MDCESYNNTSAILSPITNDIWYAGSSYNVTWDPTLPVFDIAVYSMGVDMELLKYHIQNKTDTMVQLFRNINIAQSYLTVNVTEESWNISFNDHKDYMYKWTMKPLNMIEFGETIRPFTPERCILPVTFQAVPESLAPPKTEEKIEEKTETKSEDNKIDGKENKSIGKKELTSVYYATIAVFVALAVIAH